MATHIVQVYIITGRKMELADKANGAMEIVPVFGSSVLNLQMLKVKILLK